MKPIKKTDTYNPPTEYDTSKVFIVRIEQGRKPGYPGLFYKITFRGDIDSLNNDKILEEQANVHLKHENLTGFKPKLPWPPVDENGSMSERTCVYYQATL